MIEVAKRGKLLVRLVLALLPATALPFFAFGYVAIKSHYQSLEQQSLKAHKTLVTSIGGHLDADAGRAQAQLKTAADGDVFKTKNLFLIRESLASLRTLSGTMAKVYFLDANKILIAVDPPTWALEGKPFVPADLFQSGRDPQPVSSVVVEDGMPHVYMARAIGDGAAQGWLVADVALEAWATLARAVIKSQPNMIGALLPRRRGALPFGLNESADNAAWVKIADIRAQKSTAENLEIDGEMHYLMFQDLDLLPARLVVAQPEGAIFSAPRQVAITYAGVLVGLFVVLGALLFFLTRGITRPLREIAETAAAFADGRLDVRAPVRGNDEVGLLAETFNKMGDSLQVSHVRMRVLYKSIMELFACNDADSLLRKAVELACTQCQGEVSWFLPVKAGREIAFDVDAVYVGLHGWLWKNHRSIEVDQREASGAWSRVDGDRLFAFTMKNQAQEIGTLRIAYRKNPDENMVSLLHSLISLVEMALAKQDLIHRGAMVATELEMAEAVQRNIMEENLLISKTSRIAYHYQPASRLGGDWFFLIEDVKSDSLFVVMGDVTGHGLAQGLVTTAVKGALDVIEHLLKRPDGSFACSPAAIVTLLETVVKRVAGRSELTMTCLAAHVDFRDRTLRLCNAGHTFPILLRPDVAGNIATHLHKNQQPLLGFKVDEDVPNVYADTVYKLQPKDLLIIYTDGLTEAKNLKSRIFGRFLFRSLKQPRPYANAGALRDEILEMFQYYTQNKRIEDDVCFLVVQVDEAASAREIAAAAS